MDRFGIVSPLPCAICTVAKGKLMSEQKNYIAFLVRLWSESPGIWRGALENPHTGEQRTFADVESLLAHIQQQTQSAQNKKSYR